MNTSRIVLENIKMTIDKDTRKIAEFPDWTESLGSEEVRYSVVGWDI